MTGGGFGRCNAARAGGRRFFGRGFGRGRGYGRGRGLRGGFAGWYGPAWWGGPVYDVPYTATREEEISALRDEAAGLKADLEYVNQRIQELEKESSK